MRGPAKPTHPLLAPFSSWTFFIPPVSVRVRVRVRRYPESFDPSLDMKLVYSGKYSLTDVEPETGVTVGKLVLSPTRTCARTRARACPLGVCYWSWLRVAGKLRVICRLLHVSPLLLGDFLSMAGMRRL